MMTKRGGRESGDGTETRTEGTEGPGESEKAPQERVSGPLRHSAAENPVQGASDLWRKILARWKETEYIDPHEAADLFRAIEELEAELAAARKEAKA